MKGTEVPRLRLYRPPPELRIYNPRRRTMNGDFFICPDAGTLKINTPKRRSTMAKKKKANKPPVPTRKKPPKINRKKLDSVEWQPTVRHFGDFPVEVAELADGWYARLVIDDVETPITVLTQKPFSSRVEAQEGLTRVIAWAREMFPPREVSDGQPKRDEALEESAPIDGG